MQWVVAIVYSYLESNRGGIALYLPDSGIVSDEGSVIDLSGYA